MVSTDVLWVVLFAMIGLTFGSFGTVLVARVPVRQRLGGRSQCPACKHALGAGELIPLLSYALQRGRCRHCRRAIGTMYPSVELLTTFLFVAALFLEGSPFPSILLAFALWLLLLIAVIDIRTRTIHDALNFSFVFLAGAHAVAVERFQIAGAVLLAGFFAIQWLLSRGRWVGSGDIILGAGIGLLLGSVARALLCLGLAYILGAAVALFLLATGRVTRKSTVPFGPFLALACMGVLFFGDQLLFVLLYR